MMERKTGTGHNRVMMLKTCSEMGLSECTEHQIFSTFKQCGKNTEALEQKAKEILGILEMCKTEQEVIQKLGLNSL